MKLRTALLLVSFLIAGKSFAASLGDAGCGLGGIAWQGKNSKLAQISAATTNGTFGSQTFGITTGTSGCTASGFVRADKEQEYFANVNRDALYTEMAQGRGENLAALGALMGCTPESMGQFKDFARQNYTTVFPSAETTGAEMLERLRAAIANDPEMARSCVRTVALNN